MVLLAVHKSTTLTRAAIPNSAPFLVLILLLILLSKKSIPPLCLIRASVPPITIESIAKSSIPIIPSPAACIKPKKSKEPFIIPIIPAKSAPPPNNANTLTPANAPISTAKYGSTFTIL